MQDTLLLMRLYWRLDSRDVRSGRAVRYLTRGLAWLVVLVIGVFSGFAGYGLSLLVTDPDIQFDLAPALVPGVLFSVVMIGVLLAGLGQAIKALFLSGDLDRLMAAPINTRSVMIAKLLSRLPWNVALLLLIAGPALVTYGYGLSAGPLYYVAGLLLLLLAPLFGLSLGALLAMLLVRVLPAQRLNEMLAAAYAIMGIGIGLAFQIPRFLNEDSAPPEQSVAAVEAALAGLGQSALPTMGAGRGLLLLDQGQFSEGFIALAGYILLTIGLFGLTLLVSDRLYLSGWLRTQGAAVKRTSLSEGGGVFSDRSLATGMMVKDWLLRLRDPRQLVSIFGGGAFVVVIGALTIFRGNSGQESLISAAQSTNMTGFTGAEVANATFAPGLIVAAWALFGAYVIFATAASSSLAQERQAFYTLKAAPVSAQDVWHAKTISVWIPYMVLAGALLVLGWFPSGYSLAWLPYGLLCLGLMGYGLLATATAVGFRYANLDWEDPRRMTARTGGIVSVVLSLIYGIVAVLLAVVPFGLAALFPGAAIPIALAGVVLLGLFTWVWSRWQGQRAVMAWDGLGNPAT